MNEPNTSKGSEVRPLKIFSPRLPRFLHTIGLTNLTDEQVERYGTIYQTHYGKPSNSYK